MRKRAEQVDQTRQRIVEAAVHLHGTLGPAETTVAGIAREAGVTRLTVYRHFPDDEAIFTACSAHWLAGQTPPNPAAWAKLSAPVERLRAGLEDLYRFYEEGQQMLSRVYRDKQALPPGRRQDLDQRDTAIRQLLLTAFPQGADPRLPGAIGHATSFSTWQSLCGENGMSRADAVELMTALVAGLDTGTSAQ